MPPPINHPSLHLEVLPQTFSVKKYPSTDEIPSSALSELSVSKSTTGIISVTRTAEEISIVSEADEGEWRCIKIAGPMDFELTGVIGSFAAPLKDARIPMFAISTWNTDYILVPKEKEIDAVHALGGDGWLFTERSVLLEVKSEVGS